MVLLPVKAGDLTLSTHVDQEDAERLGERGLSLGSHGYVQMWDGYVALLHRWIMGAVPHDGKLVDHGNGDILDNQKSNLKFVTAAESSANVSTTSSSGHRGVYPTRNGTWTVKAKLNGICYCLGTYATREEAAQVAHDWRVKNLPGYKGDVRREVRGDDSRTWASRNERKAELEKIRLWAAEHDLFLGRRGRIPSALLALYKSENNLV